MPSYGGDLFENSVSGGPAYDIAAQRYKVMPAAERAREAEEACRNVLTFLAYLPQHMPDIRKWEGLRAKWRRRRQEVLWTVRCKLEDSHELTLTFTSIGGEELELLKISRSLRLAELHEKLMHHPRCIRLLGESGEVLQDPTSTLDEIFCQAGEPPAAADA
mmetsp:Transcript_156769/g.278130  ORF Transcript_156769/g.278130 Transcript_156769/m.278130 type:complete len:161 (-) Transcript_156769:393-875(-)